MALRAQAGAGRAGLQSSTCVAEGGRPPRSPGGPWTCLLAGAPGFPRLKSWQSRVRPGPRGTGGRDAQRVLLRGGRDGRCRARGLWLCAHPGLGRVSSLGLPACGVETRFSSMPRAVLGGTGRMESRAVVGAVSRTAKGHYGPLRGPSPAHTHLTLPSPSPSLVPTKRILPKRYSRGGPVPGANSSGQQPE